ncbi:APC family permease [Oceanomicrobium pacificus]|uniref:Amino acid permease n=1 Tax=Oceanomicrobium pacificus TaxID=2692916 RepID=A0A6B0TUK2_9RHOB|nr:hypothetical protein [Oceanomicrobium pacificus]MXU64922.1 hypothetical protein [Oceanomicrobium pacificus]
MAGNRATDIRAMVTPLASIFGSGFLVILPILANTVGPAAPVAMAAICAVAYAVGWVVRGNIARAEPALADGSDHLLLRLDRLADIAIVVAYVISVALYLQILSGYALSGIGQHSDTAEKILTTAVLLFIVGVGVLRGLARLEMLESFALAATLAIVAALILAFALHDAQASEAAARPETQPGWWQLATVLGGALIVVQGFETTRYMGNQYAAGTRIRACRNAQILSTLIYVALVAAAIPVTGTVALPLPDTGLIALVKIAAPLLVVPLVIAAVFSQFSAAVADTIAALGNLREVSRQRLTPAMIYLGIGAAAIALNWLADTYQILALASRAFALFYLCECLVALRLGGPVWRQAAIVALGLVLLFIVLFSVPAG